jgi:glycosyltransferase involved in cell wall biosynthesis
MLWATIILILPYFFLTMKIFVDLRRIRIFRSESLPAVKVSVIIPCKNEEEKLPRLLGCLSRQDYSPENLEILVVDDNSTDRTAELVPSSGFPFTVSLLRNPRSGKKEAIKYGVEAASGTLIITIDADCTMGSSWVRTIAGFHEQTNASLILCPVMLAESAGFFGIFQELEFMSLQGITAGTASSGNGTMCNGAALAFTREVYLRSLPLLHFEHPSGDDVFLLHSIKKEKDSGIRWLESSEAAVTASSASGIREYLDQRNRWISKWKHYDDLYTIVLAAAAVIAVAAQLLMTAAACIRPSFILPVLLLFIIKSIPDYLILSDRASSYGKKHLMRWFLPSQVVYPFYVAAILLIPSKRKWKG